VNGSPYLTMNGKDVAWVPMEHQNTATRASSDSPVTPSGDRRKGKKIFTRKAEIMAEFINEVKKFKVKSATGNTGNRSFRPF